MMRRPDIIDVAREVAPHAVDQSIKHWGAVKNFAGFSYVPHSHDRRPVSGNTVM